MLIKRHEIVSLYVTLRDIGPGLTTAKGRWDATRMRQQLKDFIDCYEVERSRINEINAPFEAGRLKLCREYCEKDEKKNFKIENGDFIFSEENKPAFLSKIDDLKAQYAEAIASFNAEMEKFVLFMNGQVVMEDVAPLFTGRLSLSDFSDKISQQQIEALFPFTDPPNPE